MGRGPPVGLRRSRWKAGGLRPGESDSREGGNQKVLRPIGDQQAGPGSEDARGGRRGNPGCGRSVGEQPGTKVRGGWSVRGPRARSRHGEPRPSGPGAALTCRPGSCTRRGE